MMTSAKATMFSLALYEGLLKLHEQQQMMATPPAPPPPMPAAPQQPPAQPPQAPQTPPQSPEGDVGSSAVEVTIDSVIDKLNVIRGGKSFNDPVVFQKMSTVFNGLSDMEKAALDKILGEFQGIMADQSQQGSANQQDGTPVTAQNMTATPAMSQAMNTGAGVSGPQSGIGM